MKGDLATTARMGSIRFMAPFTVGHLGGRDRAAQARYDDQLAELSIPLGAGSVTVESARLVHSPIYLGLVVPDGKVRLVAADSHAGGISRVMTGILTGGDGYVLQAVEQAAAERASRAFSYGG